MKPALQKPRVLILFSKRGSEASTRFGGFIRRVQKHDGFEYADVSVGALEDLAFFVSNKKAVIFDGYCKQSLQDYDFVYFKGWQSMPEIANSVAIFLRAIGIPFIDEAVEQVSNPHDKRVMTMKFWSESINIIPTFFGNFDYFEEFAREFKIKQPYIVKDSMGQKGQMNFLLGSRNEVEKTLSKNADVSFVVQPYIKNEGDYRILVLGGKARFAMLRRSTGESHLNNTSSGGEASLVQIDTLPKAYIKQAENAATCMGLQITGADILVDAATKAPYVLEVNPGSQIVTGAYVPEKIAQFDKYLRNSVQKRYSRKASVVSPKVIIGRHEVVGLPQFGLRTLNAKTDSGAYSSALHAENIRVTGSGNNKVLHFQVPVFAGVDMNEKTFVDCSAKEFDVVEIKNSFGNWQNRYKIKTEVRIRGKVYSTEVTLTNRESQKVPMLLGRKLLRGNFLVNVELSRKEANL